MNEYFTNHLVASLYTIALTSLCFSLKRF